MIDTIRILVGWDCNLNCWYCCNQQAQIRSQIKPVRLADIDWTRYRCVCITGGEPLLHLDRVKQVCDAATGKLIVLYTNGFLLTEENAAAMAFWGVQALNVGLHQPPFDAVILNVIAATAKLGWPVRFQVWERFRRVAGQYPGERFRFWSLGDCDRANEDRVWLV